MFVSFFTDVNEGSPTLLSLHPYEVLSECVTDFVLRA